jgi:hypothetical protein
VPADRPPPRAGRRRTRRAADPDSPPGPLDRMWALVLRRFRNHLHSTDTPDTDPTKDKGAR